MFVHLMKVPEALVAAVESGRALVDGAMVTDVVTGRILGHLQPTRPLVDMILKHGLGLVSSPLSAVSGLVGNVQLFQIKRLVEQVQAVAGIGAAASVLNLGVSVGGFAMILASLKRMESKVDGVSRVVSTVLANQQAEFLGRCQFALRRADEAFSLRHAQERQRYWEESESVLSEQAEIGLRRMIDLGLPLEGAGSECLSSGGRLLALARPEVVDMLRLLTVVNAARSEVLLCLGTPGLAATVSTRTAEWLAPMPKGAKELAQARLGRTAVPPTQLKAITDQAKATSALVTLGERVARERATLSQSLHDAQIDSAPCMLQLHSAPVAEELVWSHTLAQ